MARPPAFFRVKRLADAECEKVMHRDGRAEAGQEGIEDKLEALRKRLKGK